jgi:hypothetical protein
MQERESKIFLAFLIFVNQRVDKDDDDDGNENRELENVAIFTYRFAKGAFFSEM